MVNDFKAKLEAPVANGKTPMLGKPKKTCICQERNVNRHLTIAFCSCALNYSNRLTATECGLFPSTRGKHHRG